MDFLKTATRAFDTHRRYGSRYGDGVSGLREGCAGVIAIKTGFEGERKFSHNQPSTAAQPENTGISYEAANGNS
jgi:hypothetical protein